jgi:hypothetical protein
MCSDVTWNGYCLCFTMAKEAWIELPYVWIRNGDCNLYIEDLEALLVWQNLWYLHRLQEFEIHLLAEGSKFEADEMDGTTKGL